MDYSIEKERSRINQIINKFTSSYTSPVSHVKTSANKLTRHRKLYSYDHDFASETNQNIMSFKELRESSLIKAPENSLKKQGSPFHNSSKQIFNFLTLREAIKAKPDATYMKYCESFGPDNKVIQVRIRKQEKMYLPRIKTTSKVPFMKKQNQSLDLYSHGSINSHLKTDLISKSSHLGENQATHFYNNSIDRKDLEEFNRKLKSFMPGVIKKTKKFLEYSKFCKNTKVIHIVPPKLLKNCYFDQRSGSSVSSNEETPI